MDGNYTVYVHTTPSNKRYVGITRQDVNRRWRNGERYREGYFKNAVKKYGWDNIQHKILHTGLDEQTAKEIEKQLIAEYKTMDRNFGYNRTIGGEGVNGLVHTEESKQKMREAHLGEKNHIYGKHVSEETKKKISKSQKRKPVAQMNKDTGEIIAIYESLSEAMRKTGAQITNISNCCKGKNRTAGNYIWKFII